MLGVAGAGVKRTALPTPNLLGTSQCRLADGLIGRSSKLAAGCRQMGEELAAPGKFGTPESLRP
jgi:hypothetical protein